MELLGDLLTAGLILLAIWTFIPQSVKASARGGLGPLAASLAAAVRAGLPAIERAAYKLVVGHPRAYVSTVAAEAPSASGTPYRPAPDTDQLEPGDTPALSTSSELPDEAALTRHMASLKKPNGQYWLSANRIAAAVGGERETALQIVRSVRGREVLPNERMLSVDGKRQITWEP
jgi:hypothetical protein